MKRAAVVAALLGADALVSGCTDRSDLPSGPSAGPAFAIWDAAHGGRQHFFFLPPLVPAAALTGVFDASLSPVVEICEWTGTACASPLVAQFPMGTGLESQTVRVNTTDEYYIVNWHTDQFALDTEKTYRIRVLVGGTELGFADVDVLYSGKELKNVTTGEFIPLVNGRTLPVKFRVERGFVARIDVVPPEVTILSGETEELVAVLTDLHGEVLGGPVAWTSSDESVATVDQTGVVTGVGRGVATITAASGGMTGSAELTVVVQGPAGRLVFQSTRDGDYEIYDMAADGSDVRRLTFSPGTDQGGRVSHDGKHIAFTSRRAGGTDLWVMNSDGSNQTRLTYWGEYTQSPTWSPDDQRILFSSNTQGGWHDLFIMNADGSGIQRITYSPDVEHDPDWSPDGTKIIFSFSGDGLHTINVDGSGLTTLLTGNAWGPRWSPDGARIAFTSYRSGRPSIYTVNSDGTGLARLATPVDAAGAVWSPDGASIAYWSPFPDGTEIFRMRSDGSASVQLTRSPGDDHAWGWRP